jgi:mRNA interferase MazF
VSHPLRGQVYRADLGYGPKPWLIVSNNARNRRLGNVLAVRMTTTAKTLPTWVEAAAVDPLVGYVNADNIETLDKGELGEYLGALSVDTMEKVNQALEIALALDV